MAGSKVALHLERASWVQVSGYLFRTALGSAVLVIHGAQNM